MNDEFVVERVVLHLVNRELDDPRFAEQEIDLAAFTTPEDTYALETFFSGHLAKVWSAQESRRTRAASFKQPSEMQQHYQKLGQDISQFFLRSRQMAKRLYDASQGTRASAGVLMVLWFRKVDDERNFLGLFKMDPGRSDKITVRQDKEGELLLDLAVRHIEQALPDPSDMVLKWAVIPHPTRSPFDVKVRDQEGGGDPAQYFMDFLGCETKPTEQEQLHSLLDCLPAYASEHHGDEDWKTGVDEVIEELGKKRIITPEVVVETIQEKGIFDGFQEQVFKDEMAHSKAKELYVSPAVLRTTKIQYRLPSGIVIKGPRAAMESLVQIASLNGDKEFRIRTPSYRKSYAH
jgi:nucleoid-associated protein YejK